MTATDWKALDDFAAGIDGNRLPTTDALAGTSFGVSERLRLDFLTEDKVSWSTPGGDSGTDWYEAVEVRPDVQYLTITDAANPLRAKVLMVHWGSGHTLTVESVIAEEPTPGRPRVDQTFTPGTIDGVEIVGD